MRNEGFAEISGRREIKLLGNGAPPLRPGLLLQGASNRHRIGSEQRCSSQIGDFSLAGSNPMAMEQHDRRGWGTGCAACLLQTALLVRKALPGWRFNISPP